MRVSEFVRFIQARERHRIAKEESRKVKRPDPIIAQYRFCNVRRNDDRVTKWIHEHWLEQWRTHDKLWFALIVARLFNNEPALAYIQDDVLPFRIERMRNALRARKNCGERNFNAAYIVSTNGHAMDKVDYLLDLVLNPLWQARKIVTREIGDAYDLNDVHKVLERQNGLGSFMAAQVVADLKYAHPNKWDDFHTFAASGPGSKRGLNRIMGTPVNGPFAEKYFRPTLLLLRDKVNARLKMEPLTAQDVQNCLCEWDKYERARLEEGTPKQLYKPAQLPWKE